ncbi:MAG: TonB-dependent receptor plug domain-containing protein, partial [Prevotella sp.]|nr:TonB-dependent receptor plug domain-containing protein [Prevotella sp.]
MMKQVKFKLPLRNLAIAGSLFLSATAFAQSGAVKGQVKDATGEPIIGATITANGKAVGVTDFDGNYSINVPKGTEITISYVGMSSKKVTASDNLVITLKDDNKTLNEVVVIGYGVAKKNDITGSVTKIQPDSKNKGLVVNAQDMLQGKVAGVNITTGGGTPGSGATIRVRGGSSLNASNDPLIVIDGIAMDNNGIKGLANPLSMVNPQDIESFSVLKDASATAIYGSRGSNGVIIITTKKGHKGTSISYSGSFTVSQKKKTIDVMDGDQYRDFIANKFGTSS